MPKKGHRPQRTCLGCGQRDDQSRLIRMTVDRGGLVLDRDRGRGGYLHPRADCRRLFIGRKGHYRAFHAEVTRAMKETLIQDLERLERE